MGKHDDHNRVAIWTERQRMDTLLTEVRIFLCRRDTQSITPGLAARAQNLMGNMSCLFRFRTGHSLAFGAIRSCLQSGSHDLLRSPPGSWQPACSLQKWWS